MMKIKVLVIILISVFLLSCVKEKRKGYKENNIFEEFEKRDGFAIFHLPPVLFKVFLNSSDIEESVQSNLLENIEIVKVLFYEEKDTLNKVDDYKIIFLQKIPEYNYNLITQITEEKNQISVYLNEEEENIHEILMVVISEKDIFCVNCIGKFTKEDALTLYKTISWDKVKNMEK